MSLFQFYVPYDYMQEYTFEPFIKQPQGMHYYEKDAHTVKLSDYPNQQLIFQLILQSSWYITGFTLYAKGDKYYRTQIYAFIISMREEEYVKLWVTSR